MVSRAKSTRLGTGTGCDRLRLLGLADKEQDLGRIGLLGTTLRDLLLTGTSALLRERSLMTATIGLLGIFVLFGLCVRTV